MNNGMSEEARAAAREYHREWRKRNPDKIREAHRRYWEKKAQQKQREEQERQAEE